MFKTHNSYLGLEIIGTKTSNSYMVQVDGKRGPSPGEDCVNPKRTSSDEKEQLPRPRPMIKQTLF